VKRTTRRTLEALIDAAGAWVNGVELTVFGGGHEATRRAREINADASIPWRVEVMRTDRGRWLRRAVPVLPPERQLVLWRDEEPGQLELWSESPPDL